MSAPQVKRTAYDDPTDAELGRWPGVTHYRTVRGKHLALVLEYGGVSRFVIYPASPSDRRGALNHLQNVRSVLRAMGAVRTEATKSQAPKRRRNLSIPAPTGEIDRTTRTRDPLAKLAEARKRISDQAPFVLPIRTEPKSTQAFQWLHNIFKGPATRRRK